MQIEGSCLLEASNLCLAKTKLILSKVENLQGGDAGRDYLGEEPPSLGAVCGGKGLAWSHIGNEQALWGESRLPQHHTAEVSRAHGAQ